MLLRHKLNLIAVGYCGMGAFVMAVCNKPVLMVVLLCLAYFNWAVALASEDKKED